MGTIEEVARLSVRLTFQSVIEEVVTQELGRGRYERRRADRPAGYRNGFQPPRTLKTTLGPVELRRPKFRHAHSTLCDQLFGAGVSRINALETLVISAWVRGLSDRDVEAILEEVFGEEAKISRSTASRVCKRLRAEFDAWERKDLSGSRIDYLYLDGSYFKMHPTAKAEPVLLAWGIDTSGKPVLLGLTPGASESADAWIAFLTELNERGMSAPLLVISDGGKGLAVAIERFVSASVHQRCTIHVARNVLAKVPKHAQGELKGDHWAIFDKLEGSGDEALAEGRRRARRFIAKCKPLYPAAAACVEDNLEALLAYLASPAEHHKRIRHSNLLERTLRETRRRVNVITRLPGEQSCLSRLGLLDRASKGWRGLTMTPDALRQLQDLRRQLLEPAQALHAPADEPPGIDADTAAAQHHVGACIRRRLHQRWDATWLAPHSVSRTGY